MFSQTQKVYQIKTSEQWYNEFDNGVPRKVTYTLYDVYKNDVWITFSLSAEGVEQAVRRYENPEVGIGSRWD